MSERSIIEIDEARSERGPDERDRREIHATARFDWSELWEKVCSWLPWGGR